MGNIGLLLKTLRKEEKVSLKELSRGICSVTTLSRIENGERKASKILFDAIISKLGKNSDKWDLILTENDKALLYYKNYINFLLNSEKWREIDIYLEKYRNLIETDNNLNEQYIKIIKAIVYKENREYDKALEECIKALELTNLKINFDNFKINMTICKSELKLLCLLGEILLALNTKSYVEIYSYWKEILNYIEQKCKDEEYKL